MITIDDFKQITLEDKPLFDKHYEKHPPIHSDNVFTTLISWRDYGNYKYALVDDNIITMSHRDDVQFRFASGKRSKDLYEQILKLAKNQESKYPIGLIDLETKNWLSQLYKNLEFIPKREYFDYVYLSSDLAELPGTPFAKIRNRLNKFKKTYNYTVEKISEENMGDIGEFLKRWCLWRDCESDPLLENERRAILYSMSHFFELGLSGISNRINKAIVAIAVYEKMSSDTAIVHYEKGSPDYDGIYKAVNQETAKILRKDFRFINRESDMDLPGLRKVKMSYRPHHLVEVYNLDRMSITL